MKTIQSLVLALIFSATAAFGQVNNYSYTFTNTATIPDGSVLGVTLTTNLGGMIGSISNITLSLDISGGFNGDYYAYLSGPNGGFAVLLDRVGVSNAASSFGYSDGGLNVTFSDNALYSIQYYRNVTNPAGGPLTGTWQPEGVTIDPLTNDPTAFFGAPQNAMLSSFDDADPNGIWKLFLADVSSGSQGTLLNWTLNITTVPEPSALTLAGLGGLMVIFRIRRRKQMRH